MFSLFDYVSNPAYAADLEVRLTTSPILSPADTDPSHYVEPAFRGYRRFRGRPDKCFLPARTADAGVCLDSLLLTWANGAAADVAITGVIVVAIWPSDPLELVAAFRQPHVLRGHGTGFTWSFSLDGEIHVY